MTFNIELLDALDEATKAKINEWHQAAVVTVTRAKETQQSELKILQERVATYGGFDGIDALKIKAETVTTAETAATTAANDKAVAEGDLSSVTAQFQVDLAQKQTQIDEMRNGLANEKKETAINSAITQANGSPLVLLPHLQNRVRAKMENGITSLEVLKVDGSLWVLETGQPATVNDLVAEFKSNDVYGGCFDAPKSSGSGSVSNTGITAQNELKTLSDIMAATKAGSITEDDARARAKSIASKSSEQVTAIH